MPITESQNRNEVKKIKFHHRVKRFYYKNLFRKIYTVAIIGLIGANIFSMVKYASFADESLVMPEDNTLEVTDTIKDIVIQVEVTEPGQTLKINKYFDNDYTVDWGDGNPVELSSDTTKQYNAVGTKTITLSLTGGADRWKFKRWYTSPLIPQAGTTVTGVQIIGMPSLAEGFGESASAPGNQFFFFFNNNGAITGLPEGSFDTSNITIAGDYFFCDFNSRGFITGLPDGSFDMSNILEAGHSFYYYFNYFGHLTYLPESFTMSSVGAKTQGGYYIAFNSPDYTLNRNVSDLVEGIALPLGRSHAFSDNQKGRCGVDIKRLDNIEGACSDEDCEDGYYAINNKCLLEGTDYGLFYGDGYIKITDGDDVMYIKDRNQGAEISMKTLFEKYEPDESNWDGNIYDAVWNDEDVDLTYGDYYFRGNNSGVNYSDFVFGDPNNGWKITNLEELESMGFNGGKIGDDNTGWEEGENGNPCNADEGEYLPTVEDWANAYLLLSNINSNIEFYRGQGGIQLGFMTEFLISPAPAIGYPYNSEGYFEVGYGPSFYTALDGSGNVGHAGYYGEDGYLIDYGNYLEHLRWNDTAAPVRCFIDPDYLAEGERYTVTFKDRDEELFTKKVKEGKLLKNVQDPDSTEEGYGFAGWYTDPELKNEFSMGTVITKDITLYAKWVEKGVFHKDGYIKVTNGKDTIYVSDKNVGATVSQGVPEIERKKMLVHLKDEEIYNIYGDSNFKQYEEEILAYVEEVLGIRFDSVDDMDDFLNSDNPLDFKIGYELNKFGDLFEKYQNNPDSLTQEEYKRGLDVINGVIPGNNFTVLEDAFLALNESDVNEDDVYLYVVNKETNKNFTREDLDEARDYVDNYNPYNPEYGEVDVNSFGNYYFRGNNNGVKYSDLELEYENGEIENMDELDSDFLEGANFDNAGWEREGNDNPCNGENEYLPSPEDWYSLMELWGNINGYEMDYGNGDRQRYGFDDWGPIDFQYWNDMLIPIAGGIDGGFFYKEDTPRSWTSLSNNGNFGMGGGSLGYIHIDEVDAEWLSTQAYPVRCFLNEEPEDEDDTPSTPVIPEPTTPSTPVNNYSGGGRKKAESVTNMHNSADEKDSTQNDAKGSENTKTPTNSSSNASEGQIEKLDMKQYNATYTPEQNTAYQFAKSHGITTTSSIREAKMNTPLTRIQMAKMLSQYAMNVLGKTPDHSAGIINFKDVTNKLNTEYDNGVTLAYQLGIMGINMPNNEFRPYDKVTRAEFATALSRMLYDMEDGKGRIKYYEPHIARLYNEGIINNTNPKMEELRGYVMTMLMRTVE